MIKSKFWDVVIKVLIAIAGVLAGTAGAQTFV
ncbi:DUF6486 family protein [Bacteroides sp. 51]|nr:DUF6486 family protein [Bacteroides sp. 51]